MLRGIRGASTVAQNTREAIWHTAQELVTKIMTNNALKPESIGAIIFSSTKDLTAAFPSSGVRKLPAFRFVPLFDAQETFVENDLPKCIRVLILADTAEDQHTICHVYLGDAKNLRPDLTGE